MKTTRECQVQGHHSSIPSRICIFKECSQYTRWCCAECIIDKLHQHGQPNDNHIKKEDEFIAFLQDQQNSKSNNLIQTCLDEIIQIAKKLISQVSNQQQGYQSAYSILLRQATNDFLSVDKAQINEIVHFINKQVYLDESSDLVQGIITKFFEFQQQYINSSRQQMQIKENIQNQQQQFQSIKSDQIQNKKIIQQPNLKYDYRDFFVLRESQIINALQISPNEQLIAYGGVNKILTVLDLKTKQKVKETKLDNILYLCQFTNDSKFIYCCDQRGVIYGYEINQNFQEIYKNQVHQGEITSICVIDSYYVVSCYLDYSIIITDMIKKTKLTTIPYAHRNWISSSQYDSIYQSIISCSWDKSIKFFSLKKGDLLIDQQNAHEIEVIQIQLTNNKSNILSISFRELILWKIEYEQRKIIQIRRFEEANNLLSFASFQNDSRIVKIYYKYLLILDNNFNIIYSYDHNIDNTDGNLQIQFSLAFSYPNQSTQLNYILILGRNEFKVLKRENQFK